MTLQEMKDEHEHKKLDEYVLYKELDILEGRLHTCSEVDDGSYVMDSWWIRHRNDQPSSPEL